MIQIDDGWQAEIGDWLDISDRVADLDEWGLATTRRLLAAVPEPVPFAAMA